ncbi:hypothetical protein FXF12_03255 [Vibrio cholerae]|nr:hypothetical protein FXF12_03255 [Vibrio cholerae]
MSSSFNVYLFRTVLVTVAGIQAYTHT